MKDTSEQMKSIMKRIKERREFLKLSFQQLADLTGMSKSTLQRYETGNIRNIPLDKLEILAKALQTTPEWILGWDREISDMDKTVLKMYPGFVPGVNTLDKIQPIKKPDIDINSIQYAAYQELEGESDELIEDVLDFIKFRKSQKNNE